MHSPELSPAAGANPGLEFQLTLEVARERFIDAVEQQRQRHSVRYFDSGESETDDPWASYVLAAQTKRPYRDDIIEVSVPVKSVDIYSLELADKDSHEYFKVAWPLSVVLEEREPHLITRDNYEAQRAKLAELSSLLGKLMMYNVVPIQ